jgi:hypothetical protein
MEDNPHFTVFWAVEVFNNPNKRTLLSEEEEL